jgi:hypothetical protein
MIRPEVNEVMDRLNHRLNEKGMNKSERPKTVVIGSKLIFVHLVLNLTQIFNYQKTDVSNEYSYILLTVIILGLVSLRGIWRMKKRAVYLYIFISLLSFLLPFFLGQQPPLWISNLISSIVVLLFIAPVMQEMH